MPYISKIQTLDGTVYDLRSSGGKPYAFSVTLTAAGWSNNTQTVSNAAFLASGYIYQVAPRAQDFDAYVAARIYAADVATDGSMVFSCGETPNQSITVNVVREEAET